MELRNTTPFPAERLALQDLDGRDLLVVVVKQTFSVDRRGRVKVSDQQSPLVYADEFYGEPGESSVKYESDLAPHKPGTDLVLVGHAYPSGGGRTKEVEVEYRVGGLGAVVRVTGDRHWKKTLGRIGMSDPQPFDRMPLVYERSFGGVDATPEKESDREGEPRNPVGRGLVAKNSKLDLDAVPLPNLEDPKDPVKKLKDRPRPAGFGFVGRSWQPRVGLAGTYDEGWLRERSPLLPRDYDPRYCNGGSEGLVSERPLAGNEPVLVRNASPEGELRFDLPGVRPRVRTVNRDEKMTTIETAFDTLVVEPDHGRFSMTWRAVLDVYGWMLDIGMVQVFADV